jgi:hypothetical protein
VCVFVSGARTVAPACVYAREPTVYFVCALNIPRCVSVCVFVSGARTVTPACVCTSSKGACE